MGWASSPTTSIATAVPTSTIQLTPSSFISQAMTGFKLTTHRVWQTTSTSGVGRTSPNVRLYVSVHTSITSLCGCAAFIRSVTAILFRSSAACGQDLSLRCTKCSHGQFKMLFLMFRPGAADAEPSLRLGIVSPTQGPSKIKKSSSLFCTRRQTPSQHFVSCFSPMTNPAHGRHNAHHGSGNNA